MTDGIGSGPRKRNASPITAASSSRPSARSRARPSPGWTSPPASIRTPIRCPTSEPEAWTRLPDAGALASARSRRGACAMARCRRKRDRGPRLASAHPGARAVFPRGASAFSASTYGGLAAALARRRRSRRRAEAARDLGGFDVAIVVNPNNPDGRVVRALRCCALHARLAGRGPADRRRSFRGFRRREEPRAGPARHTRSCCAPSASPMAWRACGSASRSPRPTSARRCGRARPWAVSGPALAIGVRALADAAWLEAMRARLGEDAARLDALLNGAGWTMIGGTSLFRLASHADASARLREAARRRDTHPPLRRRAGSVALRDAGRREGVGTARRGACEDKLNPPERTRLPSPARRIKGAHGPSRGESLHDTLRAAVSADTKPRAPGRRAYRGVPRRGRPDGAGRRHDLRANPARR